MAPGLFLWAGICLCFGLKMYRAGCWQGALLGLVQWNKRADGARVPVWGSQAATAALHLMSLRWLCMSGLRAVRGD